MTVVCFSGKARHGKDTAAGYMKEILEARGNSVLITHYADLLKYVCQMFFEWDGIKDEHGRELLQSIGTDVIRHKDPDFWVRFLVQVLRLFPDEWDYVLIPDARFPNEIDGMGDAGFDTVHVRVIRPDFDNGLTEEQQKHISEIALDDREPDYKLINSEDLDHLYREVEKLTEAVVAGDISVSHKYNNRPDFRGVRTGGL